MNTYKNKLFVIANIQESKYYLGLKKAIDTLRSNGFLVSYLEEVAKALFNDDNYSPSFDIDLTDYFVSLGGDGTFLSTCNYGVKYDRPVFGINFGHRGFLCIFRKEEIEEITPKLLETRDIELNTFLETSYHGMTKHAFNDFIIGKDNFGGSVGLNVKIDDINIGSFRADGVIVSTPIGSTAYNKTCGGNVLKRDSKLFTFTPILLNLGSVTKTNYSDDSIVTVSNTNPKYGVSVFNDGNLVSKLDEPIKIYKSAKRLKLLK